VYAPAVADAFWVLWASVKGIGEAHPVVRNGLGLSAEAKPVYGVKTDSAGDVPHASGLATGARGPAFSFMMKSPTSDAAAQETLFVVPIPIWLAEQGLLNPKVAECSP
jgi:hypothetical protein